MEADTQDKVLLHWSGEADECQSREVEALLLVSEEARRYLDELDAIRDGVAAIHAPVPTRTFAADAVAGHRAGKRRDRRLAAWLGAAAAAVIVLVGIALKSAGRGDAVNEQLANRETSASDIPVAGSGASRPKLSERLFVPRPRSSTPERIAATRERVRQFRTDLPTPSKTHL